MTRAPSLALLLTCSALPLAPLAQTDVPHDFAAGEPARAAEVNENFSTLADGIDANAAGIADNADAIERLQGSMTGVPMMSPGSVATVAASGGDYTSPQDAVANVADGDAWCRDASDDPPASPCVIRIAPGVYPLAATLVVPPFVSLVGYGPLETVLAAGPGVETTVQLGSVFPGPGVALGSAIRDLGIRNHEGSGVRSVALATAEQGGFELDNVRASASGANENIAVHERGDQAGPANRYTHLVAAAAGGAVSVGFAILGEAAPLVENCTLTAADGLTNLGVRSATGTLTARDCEIAALGGQNAIGVETVSESIYAGGAVMLYDSTVLAAEATTTSTAFRGRSVREFRLDDVELRARDASENLGVSISLNPPFERGVIDDAEIVASGGALSAGIFQQGGHSDGYAFAVRESTIEGVEAGAGYGVLFGTGTEGTRVAISESELSGSTVPMYYEGQAWLGFPPSTIVVRASTVHGPIDVNGHYVICTAVSDGRAFYPDVCPEGSDYTEFSPP